MEFLILLRVVALVFQARYRYHPHKGLSKHTLRTYFLGRKIDSYQAFLHVFFFFFFSAIFSHLFMKIAKKNHYLSNFGRGWYPPWNTSGPLSILHHDIYWTFNFPSNMRKVGMLAPVYGILWGSSSWKQVSSKFTLIFRIYTYVCKTNIDQKLEPYYSK